VARALLAAVLCVLAAGCGNPGDDGRTASTAPAATAPALARAPLPPAGTIVVASDGCGVIRGEYAYGATPENPQWWVIDGEGFSALERNALSETHYRYFRAGRYTVVLKAWDGEKYAPVSNAVAISC
jgi:hypothetical protein